MKTDNIGEMCPKRGQIGLLIVEREEFQWLVHGTTCLVSILVRTYSVLLGSEYTLLSPQFMYTMSTVLIVSTVQLV